MMADLPVLLGDVEIQPRVWIDQVDFREPGLELDGFAQVVLRSAVMGEGGLGTEERDQTKYGAQRHRPRHHRSPPKFRTSIHTSAAPFPSRRERQYISYSDLTWETT